MLEIRYYVTGDGGSPFEDWFSGLDVAARAKMTVAIARMEQGNLSRVKPIGEGVLEYKIDFGPGYRIYFGRDGETLVVLLVGGTKKRQQHDIKSAPGFWRDYKRTRRSVPKRQGD